MLLRGEVRGRFRGKREALALYTSLLEDSGYKPQPPGPSDRASDTVERYVEDMELYWSESHKHTRRGGKGRYK